MRPIRLDALGPEQLSELDQLHHTSSDSRVCIRALMVLLPAEIAAIVRQHEETVRR
jgi:hypothetical protein